MYLWDLENRSILNKIPTSIGRINKIAFRKDDEFLAVAGENEVQIWYMDNLSFIKKIKIQNKINEMYEIFRIWSDEANRIAISYLDKIAVYSL